MVLIFLNFNLFLLYSCNFNVIKICLLLLPLDFLVQIRIDQYLKVNFNYFILIKKFYILVRNFFIFVYQENLKE